MFLTGMSFAEVWEYIVYPVQTCLFGRPLYKCKCISDDLGFLQHSDLIFEKKKIKLMLACNEICKLLGFHRFEG